MLPMRIVLNAPELASLGRSAADTENGCDVIHGVCSALGRSFFVGCVGAHKIILHLC